MSSSEGSGLRRVASGGTARGVVRVPPSKSVSHRCFNLALLADRPIEIESPLVAEDTELFLTALRVCGYEVERLQGAVRLRPPASAPAGGEIFCGNAGTMFRFLVATLAVRPGVWRLDGTPRLRERPVGPLIEALRTLGADIRSLGAEGYAPLEIRGGALEGEAHLDAGSSSQFLSAILMAAQRAGGEVRLEIAELTSRPYVEITLEAIEAFGGRVEAPSQSIFIVRPPTEGPVLGIDRIRVEGDYSAAAYPAAASALTAGSVTLEGLSPTSPQGDRGFLDLLAEMGARVEWSGDRVTITGGRLAGVDRDLSAMPDQVPTLAALAPFAAGVTHVTNVPHLRIKESDRLAAMTSELRRAGAEVEEAPDGLTIPGIWAAGEPPGEPVVIDPHDDHRIAMSLALVGLRRPGLAITHPEVVGKSYPDFWRDLDRLLVVGAPNGV